jgi:hypothetical protein
LSPAFFYARSFFLDLGVDRDLLPFADARDPQ